METGSVARRLSLSIVVALIAAIAVWPPQAYADARDDDREVYFDPEVDDAAGNADELGVGAGDHAAADVTSGATAPDELDRGIGLRPVHAPHISEVLEAAYAAAGLAHDPTRGWRRRARVAGLVPWVSVRVGWDAKWHDDEPGDVGRSRDFEVRATWRLDRLVFDGRELQAATIDAARRRERRRLASRVIRAYFAWRKITTAAHRDGRFRLAVEAATAELDALTDGWFSDRLAAGKGRRPPSEDMERASRTLGGSLHRD